MLSKALLQIWFTHLKQHMHGFVAGGVFVCAEESADFAQLVAIGGDFRDSQYSRQGVDSVAKNRKSVVRRLPLEQAQQASQDIASKSATIASLKSDTYQVCVPVRHEREVIAIVCIELCKQRDDPARDILTAVEAAVFWLESLVHSKLGADSGPNTAAIGIELCAIALSQENALDAAIAVASRMAQRLQCERIAFAYLVNHEIRMYALSHNIDHALRQNLVRRVEAAIQESVDQKETLKYPAVKDTYQALQAHKDLSSNHGSSYICSVPLVHGDVVIGGICYERTNAGKNFTEQEIKLFEQCATLVGTIIEYRRRDDCGIIQKLTADAQIKLRPFAGSHRPAAKTLAALGALLVIAMFFIQWQYRITANASLEGAIERVITAPEAGFIKQAWARPGDILGLDQAMATLDDRDLELEKLKWSGKQQQISREYREALATHDRSKIGIMRAQLDQTEAQIAILDKKLQRTKINAPIAGVVVSGDYTRALGSPVEKGQILYKVSPLLDYRVLLEVDEADIKDLEVGMRGELTLTAAAEDSYTVIINTITPVSRAENGVNYFQLVASLEDTPEFLRPGMRGVVKIEVGQRQLLWIWTHKMVDWLRLKLWVWW